MRVIGRHAVIVLARANRAVTDQDANVAWMVLVAMALKANAAPDPARVVTARGCNRLRSLARWMQIATA
jgi:hypothetical protein